MSVWILWAFFSSYICSTTICNCESGFILTSPKVLDSGSTEHFILTLFDIPVSRSAVLSLRSKKDDTIIVQKEIRVESTSNGFMQISMEIPFMQDSEAWLQITGSFLRNGTTNEKKEVAIRRKSIITFVQTDKPIYKPGQTVRFRVLPLDSELKPLNKDALGDVWIEGPGSIRIAQWKNVNFSLGIIQLELPLSEEPVLGVWSIKTTVDGYSHSQTFSVKEYVLPKYEVIIKAPKYLLKNQDPLPFPIEICAQYTYGKKVDGELNVTVKDPDCRTRTCTHFLSPVQRQKISGCHTFHFKLEHILLLQHPFRSARDVMLYAEVTESGTGITRNASAVIQITQTALRMKFLGFEKGNKFFKPGLPLYETLLVSKPDHQPATFKDIQICYTLKGTDITAQKVCDNYTTDERGEISFSVPRSSPAYYEMELKATATGKDATLYRTLNIPVPSETVTLKAWYSSSGSHLQIQPIYKRVSCGKQQQVKIHYTTHNGSTINFHYQVISKGRIVQQGSHSHTAILSDDAKLDDSSDKHTDFLNGKLPPYVGEFNLTFDAQESISPIARLLVFYLRPDDEVVSDSREFDIAQCFSNKANLGFSSERQYPSTEVEVLLSATPFSLCGVGIVDKSVHLINPEKQINREKVFKIMGGYDLSGTTAPTQTSEHHCPKSRVVRSHTSRRGSTRWDESPEFFHPVLQHRDKHVDSITAFENAGMVVISNYVLETRACYKETSLEWIPDPVYIRDPVNIRRRFNRPPTMAAYGHSLLFDERPEAGGIAGNIEYSISEKRPSRKEKIKLVPKSVADVRNYFPETWLWELHSIGENGKNVLNRTLPDTVTEWVGSTVCIHPVAGLGISDVAQITAFQPFFVSFTLPYSAIREEVIPVIIKVFNYLTECLPIKLSLEPNEAYAIVRESKIHKLCVCGGESKSHRFHIRPFTLGLVNITVHGYSLDDDAICGSKATAKVSARDAVTRPLLIEAEGFPKEEIFNSFLCPKENNGTFSKKIDLLLPANAIQGSARAYFTIVGDVMAPALNNLDKLVRLPTGCGEQNMIRFVPNIFVLDYLIASGKVTEEIKSKTTSHMETGYQRELRYRHADGSYSAFGSSDKEGSLWLTAFVVRSFSHARRFIAIDEKDLTHSTQWIVRQQRTDGCFRRVGTVFHKAMKGGLSYGGESLTPLTAYVSIALLEAGFSSKEVVTNAIMCLQSDSNTTTYSLALFAYAAALAKDTKAQAYLEQLISRAITEGDEMYWKYEDGNSRSVDIETAAYAILVMLEAGGADNIPKVLPIVRWITKQRNSDGGFVSTQDTVVALQALAKYASLVAQNKVNIEAVIESDELLRSFKVDATNKLLTQRVKFPVVPTVVDFNATGEGCALAQFSLRYNVQFSTGSEAFDLNVTTFPNDTNSCTKPGIGICIRYRIPRETSNMVVVTVKMISGYISDKMSIKKLYEDDGLALKRHDIDGSAIHFYFPELTNEQKCFRFLIKNEFDVEDAKPATVKLYDYYQTELEITKNYEIPSPCVSATQP